MCVCGVCVCVVCVYVCVRTCRMEMQGPPCYVVLRHLDFDDIAIVFMVLREFIDFIVRSIFVVCIVITECMVCRRLKRLRRMDD